MNYGDREKSKLPDSPIEPYIASWKERRKYALLQASSKVYGIGGMGVADAVTIAFALEAEIERRLPESAE